MKFKAKLLNGKLVYNRNQLNEFLAAYQDGCTFQVTLERATAKRSNQQNAYYWSVVIPLIQEGMKELGNRLTLNETENWLIQYLKSTNNEMVHQFLKMRFIEDTEVNEGEIINVKQSTARMNKEQFSIYLHSVIQFANETLEIYIPKPNEYENENN